MLLGPIWTKIGQILRLEILLKLKSPVSIPESLRVIRICNIRQIWQAKVEIITIAPFWAQFRAKVGQI